MSPSAVMPVPTDSFPDLRVALNRISDRYFFPNAPGSVERMLRQVADSFEG
jgi:hypothetical protein